MAINQTAFIHEWVVCSNVFIRKDDKFLVLKRSPLKKYAPGVTHPVGGKLDPGENPYEAALREVEEETGLRVGNLRLKAVILEVAPIKESPKDWLIFHFTGDFVDGEVQQTEEGELVWLTKDEIVQQKLFPSVRETINTMLDPTQGTVFASFTYDETGEINGHGTGIVTTS